MTPLSRLAAFAILAAVAARAAGARPARKQGAARHTRMMEKMLAAMPDDAPPKLVRSVLPRLREQNETILKLLREQNDLLRVVLAEREKG